MKNLYYVLPVLVLTCGLSMAQDLTGEQIIQKVNDQFNPETSHGISKMTITTSSGEKRTFVSESWSKDNGEKNLVRYISPRRVKDQAILMLNNADDIWSFFPRTRRVRKLATHAKKQKMQGSDFSYEDMGSGDAFIDDFIPRRLEDEEMKEQDCFKLELTRKPEGDLSYSRLIMWITKETFVPIVIDYYDEDDPELLLKRLVQSDIRMIGDIPTAFKAVMHNVLDQTQTELELIEIEFGVELKDEMFSERNLKK